MKGFPKKIATGADLYNCLSLVQAGEIPASELSAAIAAVEAREYITVPVLEISEDRKTVVINPCAEAVEGVKIKNDFTTTIKEAKQAQAGSVRQAFDKITEGASGKLEELLPSVETGSVLEKAGSTTNKSGAVLGEAASGSLKGEVTSSTEQDDAELMIVTLSRAMQEGESALKILADTSPYDVLGISAEEVQSIKGVLKNYAISDK